MGADKEKLAILIEKVQNLEQRIHRLELQFFQQLAPGPRGLKHDSVLLKPKEDYTIFECLLDGEYFGILDFGEMKLGDEVQVELSIRSLNEFKAFRSETIEGPAREPIFTFGPLVCSGISLHLKLTAGRSVHIPYSVFWREWSE